MSVWKPLDDELAIWADEGRSLPLWWRDDDAIRPTGALDRLEDLAERFGLPLHLAVIPAHATRALAERVAQRNNLIPLVHGWAHENHAPPDTKKCEFGANRPLSDLTRDAAQGFERLSELFGTRLAPVFVPPWNRMANAFAPDLPGLGFRAISQFTPRTAPFAAPGLLRINTHIDPIAWKSGGTCLPPETLAARVAALLSDRRAGQSDPAEPLGLLTHHLVHDDAIWQVCEALLSRLAPFCPTPWRADHALSEGCQR